MAIAQSKLTAQGRISVPAKVRRKGFLGTGTHGVIRRRQPPSRSCRVTSWCQALDLVFCECRVRRQHRDTLDERLRNDHAVEWVPVVPREHANA